MSAHARLKRSLFAPMVTTRYYRATTETSLNGQWAASRVRFDRKAEAAEPDVARLISAVVNGLADTARKAFFSINSALDNVAQIASGSKRMRETCDCDPQAPLRAHIMHASKHCNTIGSKRTTL